MLAFLKNLLGKGIFFTIPIDKIWQWFRRKPAPLPAPKPIMKLHERFLAIALAEVGKGETTKNNAGPDVATYKGTMDIKSDLGPWCASGTSWCFAQALGGTAVASYAVSVSEKEWNRRRHGAKSLFNMFRNEYGTVAPTQIRPGDVVLWQRGVEGSWQGHIAVVSRVEPGTGHFWAVEFNRGGYPSKVKEFEHVTNEAGLLGFARIGV